MESHLSAIGAKWIPSDSYAGHPERDGERVRMTRHGLDRRWCDEAERDRPTERRALALDGSRS
jgi:hypothetical protein